MLGLQAHKRYAHHDTSTDANIGIGESLSQTHAKEKKQNRQYLLKVLQNVRFIARQGLPLQGDGIEENSNFIQLLKLRAEDDSRILDYMSKKTDKYTSATVVNEMLQIMALAILIRESQTV